MPHSECNELTAGPAPTVLRAMDDAFNVSNPLDAGGNSYPTLSMAGGGGTLTEAELASDAPETSKDLQALTSRVHEYATTISDALGELEATDDASIREAIARKITNTLGFLNAWMDHFYIHPAYKATETLREEGMDKLLRFKNPTSVTAGIAQMRQFIAAVLAIDLAEAEEVPYDRLYSSESNAAFQGRLANHEAKKVRTKREMHGTSARRSGHGLRA